MDIHQFIDGRAALTHMTSVATRMRGIGQGQTIEIVIIPEVLRLIDDRQKLVQRQAGAAPLQVPIQTPNAYGSDIRTLASSASTPVGYQAGDPRSSAGDQRGSLAGGEWYDVRECKFRTLCHQSVDKVVRKRAYSILTGCYSRS